MRRTPLRLTPAALLMVSIAGCSSDDQMLQQSLQHQAEQNERMARHTQQIVETSRGLVEADAKARGELIELQQEIQAGGQADRQSLDRQHEQLEAERKAIARQRHRDPLIAAAIIDASVLLACIAPLLLALWVLRSSWAHDSGGVDELLIHELTSENPVFLPRPTVPLPLAEAAADPTGALKGPTTS